MLFRYLSVILLSAAVLGACAPEAEEEAPAAPPALGPADGRELPATDLERVGTGMVAPDFTLASLEGPTFTLSQFRGSRNVILVFYRGWW